MHDITLYIGQTNLSTQDAILARDVLERVTGLVPRTGELLTSELLTSDELTPPAIGQYWHSQGGTYAGVMRGEKGAPDYHLIAPPHAWIESITYGGDGYSVVGADHIRDGLANTQALLAHDIDHPAASWASQQQADGHRDLYLPSRAEAYLCWANIPEQFERKVYHITSTQLGPSFAWIQVFDAGYQNAGRKGYARPAFAVRRILIPSTLNALSPRA